MGVYGGVNVTVPDGHDFVNGVVTLMTFMADRGDGYGIKDMYTAV